MEKADFFNEDQKEFKARLLEQLLRTMNQNISLFAEHNNAQHTIDLLTTIIVMFSREIFVASMKFSNILDADQAASHWRKMSKHIEDGILKLMRSEEIT